MASRPGVAGQEAQGEHGRNGDERIAHHPQRSQVMVQQLRDGITHQQSTDDCRQQDAAAGAGEPVELVDRVLYFRRRYHGRDFFDLLVNRGEGQGRGKDRVGLAHRLALGVELGRVGLRIHDRAGIEQVFEALSAPGKDKDREDDPRHPCAHLRRVWRRVAKVALGFSSGSASTVELSARPDKAAEVCTVALKASNWSCPTVMDPQTHSAKLIPKASRCAEANPIFAPTLTFATIHQQIEKVPPVVADALKKRTRSTSSTGSPAPAAASCWRQSSASC